MLTLINCSGGSIYDDARIFGFKFFFIWIWLRRVYVVHSIHFCQCACVYFAKAYIKCFRHSKGSTDNIWAHRFRWQTWRGMAWLGLICSRVFLFLLLSFHLMRADDMPHFKLDSNNCSRDYNIQTGDNNSKFSDKRLTNKWEKTSFSTLPQKMRWKKNNSTDTNEQWECDRFSCACEMCLAHIGCATAFTL